MIMLHAKEWVTIPRLTDRNNRIAIIEESTYPDDRMLLNGKTILIDGARFEVCGVSDTASNGVFELMVRPTT